jgi:hypothetical protein
MIEIMLYLFLKTYLNPLIIDYFFSRNSVKLHVALYMKFYRISREEIIDDKGFKQSIKFALFKQSIKLN